MPPASPSPSVTWRSVLIGLIGVVFICGVTPYNDFAMENTFLVGNFLPIGLLMILLVLVLAVNVPLRRLLPAKALRRGELATIVLMVLVGCAVPSSGLMRYLPGSLVGTYIGAAERPVEWGPPVDAAKMPEWLLPTVDGASAAEKGYQPVFTEYRARSPDGRVPWAAWVRPAVTWGVLIALLWGLLLCLSLIVRTQWAENERLTFPLATIYGSLIETPEPGRLLAPLFRSRGFWTAAGVVFFIRSLNALHAYDSNFPLIPLGYDWRDLLSDAPWSFTSVMLKTADLSFSMIGIAFFIQTKTAFSLWAFFALWQGAEMVFGTLQIPFTEPMKQDQTIGAVAMFALVTLYLGRRHWWLVIRQMIGRHRVNDSAGTYLPYGVTGWLAVACFFGILVWLRAAGVGFAAGSVITIVVVLIFMVVARVLADTGLMFVQINYPLFRSFYYPVLVLDPPRYTTPTNFLFAGWFTELFHDTRELLVGMFQTGIRVTDQSLDRPRRRTGVALMACVVLSLGVGYVTSWASMLKVEYTFAQTTSVDARTPNNYGVEDAPRANILSPMAAYQSRSIGQESKSPLASPLLQVGFGAVVVGVCSALRVLLSWWPLHPVGFVVLYSFATQKIWFSIFVGWVLKVAVVRIGGASLLKAGRPVFTGLILGESFAAAFWLLVNVVLHLRGLEYKPMMFLPG